LATGIADIVESELSVGDIIIATGRIVGNLINDPRQHRSNVVHIVKAHGSTNVALVRVNIRGEHLDPLTRCSVRKRRFVRPCKLQ